MESSESLGKRHSRWEGQDDSVLSEGNFSVCLYKGHLQAPETLLQWGKPWPVASFLYFCSRFSNLSCPASPGLCLGAVGSTGTLGSIPPGGTCQWGMSLTGAEWTHKFTAAYSTAPVCLLSSNYSGSLWDPKWTLRYLMNGPLVFPWFSMFSSVNMFLM